MEEMREYPAGGRGAEREEKEQRREIGSPWVEFKPWNSVIVSSPPSVLPK